MGRQEILIWQHQKKVTEAEVSAVEKRKVKNYWARITLSWGIVGTFFSFDLFVILYTSYYR